MQRKGADPHPYKQSAESSRRSFGLAWLVVILLVVFGGGMSASAMSIFRTAPPPAPTATPTALPASPTAPPTATAMPTATATATPLPAPSLSLNIANTAPIQGQTLLVRVTLDRTATLDGDFDGQPLIFHYDSPTEAWALLAIEADALIGPRSIVVSATAPEGAVGLVSQPIEIQEAAFGAQRIPVSSELSLLLLPEIRTIEAQYLANRMQEITVTPLWQGPFGIPTQGEMTSPFGASRAYADGPISTYHGGLDFAAATGAGVFAAAGGRVRLAEPLTVHGNTVVIDHGMGVYTLYAHLSQIDVAVGQDVARGDWIGAVGSSGLSTGPHLHWEIYVNGSVVNPSDWLSNTFP